MTTVMDGHIVLDDQGVAHVAGSDTRVIDVVLDQRAYGLTPEQIHHEHPHLSLAQIHAAFAYYYDHQSELDAEIERRFREVEEMRRQAPPSPLTERLRHLGKRP